MEIMKGRDYMGTYACMVDNIEMELKEVSVRIWTGFICLMIESGGCLL
jgi:hypothetical protein